MKKISDPSNLKTSLFALWVCGVIFAIPVILNINKLEITEFDSIKSLFASIIYSIMVLPAYLKVRKNEKIGGVLSMLLAIIAILLSLPKFTLVTFVGILLLIYSIAYLKSLK